VERNQCFRCILGFLQLLREDRRQRFVRCLWFLPFLFESLEEIGAFEPKEFGALGVFFLELGACEIERLIRLRSKKISLEILL
jgi:hypothetical protein